MATGWTNRGKRRIVEIAFADVDEPTVFKMVLITAGTPDAETNVLSGLTEHANSGGYTTGGSSITRATGFGTPGEDDTNDRGSITIDDITWTASGAGIVAVTYALLMDDEATPNVIAYFDLSGPVSQTVVGQPFTITNAELRIDEG